MKQFPLRTFQQVEERQNRQNLSPLKSSTKQNLDVLKNIKPFKDSANNLISINDMEFMEKTLKNYQETICRQKLQIQNLKFDLQSNKEYTAAIQQKYTILLQAVQPFEEKVKVQNLVNKISQLQNTYESQSRIQTETSSFKFLKLNKDNSSMSSQESNFPKEQNFSLRSQQSIPLKNLSISSNLLIKIPSQVEEVGNSKNSTTKKDDKLRKQSTDSDIGVQVCLFQNYKTPIKKDNIQKFISLESQLKNNELHLSRKRKNSEFEENLSAVWGKLINEHLNNQQPLGTKFKHKSEYLLKKGVPYELRSTVWPMVFQNPLGLTWQFYMQLLDRREKGWIDESVKIQIQKDLNRSFTGKGKQLQNRTKLIDEVQQVLQLFHLYRPDVSYVQGMTYPAIVLTTVVGKMKAFCILANQIIGIPFIKRLYTFEGQYPTIYCRTFDYLLKDVNSGAFQMLKRKHVSSQLFLIEWFYTFFSRGLNFETILKVWDHMAYFGEITIFKLAVTVIELVSSYLTDATYQGAMGLIKQFSSYVDDKKLIEAFLNCKVTEDKFKKAYKKAVKSLQN